MNEGWPSNPPLSGAQIAARLAGQAPTIAGLTIARGTITTDLKAIDSSVTWNNAAVTFTGIKLNVTDTASNAASLLMDLQVGGSSKYGITKGGTTSQRGQIIADTGTGATPALIVATTTIQLAGADGLGQGIQADAWAGTGFSLYGRASGGTRASPSATTGDRVLLNALGYGHDGTNYTTSPSIRYQQQADGLWSGSNRGTYHTWYGTPNGSTTAAEWMRLQNANLGIGVAPTSGNGLLQLASGTTKANGIAFGAAPFFYRASGDEVRLEGGGGGIFAFGTDTVNGNFFGSQTNQDLRLLANYSEKFRVKTTGQCSFVPLSSDPGGAANGDVYYNSTSNKLRVYAGGSWVDLH